MPTATHRRSNWPRRRNWAMQRERHNLDQGHNLAHEQSEWEHVIAIDIVIFLVFFLLVL